MRRLLNTIAVICLVICVTVPVAEAAGKKIGVPYEGKTSGGHKVTFMLTKRKALQFETGVPMNCLAIQGGGAPITGVEPFIYTWLKVGNRNAKLSDYVKPAFHYNEVTRNHTITLVRGKNKTVRGSIRTQYQFLIPKFPIGTFTIYSCLGNMKFKARPVRG